MKKYILSLFVLATSLVACTGDYTDWSSPQSNAQEDAVAFGNGSVTSVDVINLAAVTTDSVKVANITAPTASDAAYAPAYKITLGGETFDIDANGNMAKFDLAAYVTSTYGKRPVERDIEATLAAWVNNGSTSVKMATSSVFAVKVVPEAPFIDGGYYLVGDMFNNGDISGWSAEGMKAFSQSGKDVYEDPTFTISFTTTADNQYWKIIPKTSADAGDIWADGVVGPKVDGDESSEGSLTNTEAQAGKIAKAGKYKMTLNMMDYTYTIEEVKYDPFIYFIGATDGWTNAEQKLALTDENNGTYTGFIYCADPNDWGNQFKFQRVAGSWDNEINSGTFTTFDGAATDEGGNIGVSAGEGVYYFEVSLGGGSIKATKVETMGIIGDFNGWGGDAEMTWNADEYCYEASNPGVTASGWKFRINADWGINLGGSLGNLVLNGDNLSAEGTSIKLYPTRKTSDNIYCTVK